MSKAELWFATMQGASRAGERRPLSLIEIPEEIRIVLEHHDTGFVSNDWGRSTAKIPAKTTAERKNKADKTPTVKDLKIRTGNPGRSLASRLANARNSGFRSPLWYRLVEKLITRLAETTLEQRNAPKIDHMTTITTNMLLICIIKTVERFEGIAQDIRPWLTKLST
jgi:hypothetical protein